MWGKVVIDALLVGICVFAAYLFWPESTDIVLVAVVVGILLFVKLVLDVGELDTYSRPGQHMGDKECPGCSKSYTVYFRKSMTPHWRCLGCGEEFD